MDPDANLAVVTDEACEAASDVLANKVHVALAAPPQARLHYRELRMRARPVKDPAAAVPAEEDPKDAVMRIAAAPPDNVDTPPAVEGAGATMVSDDEPVVVALSESTPEPVPLTASAPAEERPHETTPRT